MSIKAPLERSLKSLRTRHLRGVKAAKQRLREVEEFECPLDLFPVPYISIRVTEDGRVEELSA